MVRLCLLAALFVTLALAQTATTPPAQQPAAPPSGDRAAHRQHMQQMRQHHMQEMQAHMDAMRSGLERLKAASARISDASAREAAQHDAEMWTHLLAMMDSMHQHMQQRRQGRDGMGMHRHPGQQPPPPAQKPQ